MNVTEEQGLHVMGTIKQNRPKYKTYASDTRG